MLITSEKCNACIIIVPTKQQVAITRYNNNKQNIKHNSKLTTK